ncbi:hypothetical protein [Planococcus shixiaomingii]|uniref:hypothetical protein n=1 Tax=Planococcus shixiaomingii TaxID=3058393 RepID=UPI00260F8291|nr:hypothetical protein [Planococcus sp. N022]WKA56086.1 hypothetical protein QWY21_07010 [Planococcus sp. N022]
MKKFILIGVISFLTLAVITTIILSAFFHKENPVGASLLNPNKQQTTNVTADDCANLVEEEYTSDGTTFTQSYTIKLSSDEAEPFPDPTMDLYEEARKQLQEAVDEFEESEMQFNVSDEFIFSETDWEDGEPLYSQLADLLTMPDDSEVVDLYGYIEEMERQCKSLEQ